MEVSVKDIEEPGEYRLVYHIKDGTEKDPAKKQSAEITFTVFPWSMTIVTLLSMEVSVIIK
mgnify:CR=1 FL=1